MSDELPENSRRLFAHYDDPGHLVTYAPELVIARLLEEGDRADLQWLTGVFSAEQLADWLDRHGPRLLSRRSHRFWLAALDRPEPAGPETGASLWPL